MADIMMQDVRTTLTIEPDVAEALERAMSQRGEGMKAVVNDALRRGLGLAGAAPEAEPFEVRPHSFGFRPGVDLDRLNQLVDELYVEDWLAKQGSK